MQGLILGTRDVNIPILSSQDSWFKSQERKNNIYWSRRYFKEIKGQGIWAMGKRAPSKIFKILFLFETSKNDDFKLLFFSQNCPFSRNCPFTFQNFPLVFWSAFFLFAVHVFFQECFFPPDFTFSSYSDLVTENICLPFVLFTPETLYWPTYDTFLIILKPLHGVWFFMYFI